jgi:hypothetical protein
MRHRSLSLRVMVTGARISSGLSLSERRRRGGRQGWRTRRVSGGWWCRKGQEVGEEKGEEGEGQEGVGVQKASGVSFFRLRSTVELVLFSSPRTTLASVANQCTVGACRSRRGFRKEALTTHRGAVASLVGPSAENITCGLARPTKHLWGNASKRQRVWCWGVAGALTGTRSRAYCGAPRSGTGSSGCTATGSAPCGRRRSTAPWKKPSPRSALEPPLSLSLSLRFSRPRLSQPRPTGSHARPLLPRRRPCRFNLSPPRRARFIAARRTTNGRGRGRPLVDKRTDHIGTLFNTINGFKKENQEKCLQSTRHER